MPTRNTRPAKLFNLDSVENVSMSGLPLPPHILMPIMFMESTGVLSHNLIKDFLRARQIMQEIIAAGFLEPANLGVQSKIEPYIGLEVNTLGILREHLRSSAWTYHGFYLQAGFADAQKANGVGLYRAIATAQTFHDMMYVQTGSLDLALHTPLVRSARAVREYQSAVDGFYAAEIAIWRQQLLQYHTAALVMLRAAWMNRDPRREYLRFLNAGGDYFLHYPTLCP